MNEVTSTNIWRRTLADQGTDDPHREARSRLRNSFEQFRSKADTLAKEIPRDLPSFTVHDMSHIDALWGIADLIIGDEYPLTPTEAYVLGGAFLLHDLGLGLSSYPGGVPSLKDTPEWSDALAVASRGLKRRMGAVPAATFDRLAEQEAIQIVLRQRHATQSEQLGLVEFRANATSPVHYLIEDTDLRTTYGRLIGRIAYSHWWAIDRLESDLQSQIGAFVNSPTSWDIDPVKLACILRAADACHIDARRAPSFLRALRKPEGVSNIHWKFQEYLQKPIMNGRQLKFTSPNPIPANEMEVWWQAYDTLAMADDELKGVDSLLRDTGRATFSATGIEGANDATRLAKLVPTDGWEPVDTALQISDVAALIRNLGGEATYGNSPEVPLRELIQNAQDAIVARRKLEDRTDDWGEIRVSSYVDDADTYISVADNGVGMSKSLLTGHFLDFGKSYWYSEQMLRDHPGLAEKQFEPEGRFGIGFFSVFMWGDHVTVTTRSVNAAPSETLVLCFQDGLTRRPLLRLANLDEQRREPGTELRVRLRNPDETLKALRKAPIYVIMSAGGETPFRHKRKEGWDLSCLAEWLCPSLAVDLTVVENGTARKVVTANDWLTMDSECFWDRLLLHHPFTDKIKRTDWWLAVVANTQVMRDTDGIAIGRGLVTPGVTWLRDKSEETILPQVISCGGLRSWQITHQSIVGIMAGDVDRASRFHAVPKGLRDPYRLSKWASQQSRVVEQICSDPLDVAYGALKIRGLCGDLGPLKVFYFRGELITYDELKVVPDLPPVVHLVDYYYETWGNWRRTFEDHEIGVRTGFASGKADYFDSPDDPLHRAKGSKWGNIWFSLWAAALEAISYAWGSELQLVLDNSQIQGGHETLRNENGSITGMRLSQDVIRRPASE